MHMPRLEANHIRSEEVLRYFPLVHQNKIDFYISVLYKTRYNQPIGVNPMNYKHTPNEKQAIIFLYRNGQSVAHISLETGVPRSTIYNWLKETSCDQDTLKELTRKNFRMFERKVERLERIIEILKSAGCLPSDPLDIKLEALESLHNENKYSVHMLCEALDVPRGTFYNHILRNKRENTSYAQHRKELCAVIQQVYDESHQIFGANKDICHYEGKRLSHLF